jgi:hypothetical protein
MLQAMALASSVLPVPGGPYSSTPCSTTHGTAQQTEGCQTCLKRSNVLAVPGGGAYSSTPWGKAGVVVEAAGNTTGKAVRYSVALSSSETSICCKPLAAHVTAAHTRACACG